MQPILYSLFLMGLNLSFSFIALKTSAMEHRLNQKKHQSDKEVKAKILSCVLCKKGGRKTEKIYPHKDGSVSCSTCNYRFSQNFKDPIFYQECTQYECKGWIYRKNGGIAGCSRCRAKYSINANRQPMFVGYSANKILCPYTHPNGTLCNSLSGKRKSYGIDSQQRSCYRHSHLFFADTPRGALNPHSKRSSRAQELLSSYKREPLPTKKEPAVTKKTNIEKPFSNTENFLDTVFWNTKGSKTKAFTDTKEFPTPAATVTRKFSKEWFKDMEEKNTLQPQTEGTQKSQFPPLTNLTNLR